jgi:methylenetetrahydrofolate dehydrogenase (NADP+)/methenyltetrahydrofolate cyclohydrolase
MPKTTAQLIDGKALAEQILLELKSKISKLNRPPGLAVILIGNDPASHRYVKKKKEACKKIGIEFHDYLCGGKFCPDVTEKQILDMIDFLNKDNNVDGILVQLPIPNKFSTQKIINKIDPKKDVDGFHPENKVIPSPLIRAIDEILNQAKEDLKDKTALIVSKNPIFSNPLNQSLAKHGLNVKTAKPDENLSNKTKQADVLITVVGKPKLIKKSMVKKDAIVIDAGTTLVGKNIWQGDVDPKVTEVASWLTPVPGGIGPLTVAFLLKNTYELAKEKQ